MKNFLQVNRALKAKKHFNFKFKHLLVLSAVLLLGSVQVWGETVDCSGASATSSSGFTNKSTSTNYTVYFSRGSGGWSINSGYGYQGKTDAIAVFELLVPTNVYVIVSNVDNSKARAVEVTAKPFKTVALGEEFLSILEVSYSKPAKYAECVSSSKNYAEVATTSAFYDTNHSTMCTLSNTQLSTSVSYSTGEKSIATNTTGVRYSLGILPAGVYAAGFTTAGNSNVTLAGFEFSPANPTFSVSADAELTAETDAVTLTSAGNTIYYKWSDESNAYAANAGSTLAGEADGSGTSPVDATAPDGTGTYYLYTVAKNGTYYSDVVKRSYTIVAAAASNTYTYTGQDNSWGSTAMTVSDGGLYEYIHSTRQSDHQFKIKEGSTYYNWTYTFPGFCMTNLTTLGNQDGDNCKVWDTPSSYYIIVFKPNTTLNSSSNPRIATSTTLPDDTEEGLAKTKMVYLVPGSGWETSSPKYAVYYEGHSRGWSDYMTASPCIDGAYQVEIPALFSSVQFMRMNPEGSKSWNDGDYWNYTAMVTMPTNKPKFTVNLTNADWNSASTDGSNWSTVTTYTISFNANKGSGSISSITGIDCNTSRTLPAIGTDITRSGWTFVGWNTDKYGGGTSYADGATISNITSNITLYAQWQRKIYFYSTTSNWYDDDAKTQLHCWDNDDNTKNLYVTMTRSDDCSNPIVYEATIPGGGYDKLQFKRLKSDESESWNETVDLDFNSSYNMYKLTNMSGGEGGKAYGADGFDANYSAPSQYTITFAANGGDGSMSAIEDICEETDQDLTANSYSKTGYDFAGWKTNAALTYVAYGDDDDGTHEVSSAVNDIVPDKAKIKEVGSDITLTAQWTAQEYSITYKDQSDAAFSGMHIPGYPTTHTYGSSTTLVKASKNGYVFGGWYTASDCSTGLVTSIGASDKTANFKLYAKWNSMSMVELANNTLYKAENIAPDGLTISTTTYLAGVSADQRFNSIGSTATSNYDDASVAYSPTSATISGASFTNAVYFENTADASGTDIPTNHAIQFKVSQLGNLDIYCRQPKNIYLVKSGESAVQLDASETSTAKITKEVTAGTYYLYANEKSTGPRLYGLKFTPKYTVTYNLNGGQYNGSSDAPTQVAVTSGTEITMPSMTPTKDGYAFLGWRSSANSTDYAPGASYTMTAANTTFTAQWQHYANSIDIENFIKDGPTSDQKSSFLTNNYYLHTAFTNTAYEYNLTSGKEGFRGLKMKDSGFTLTFYVPSGKDVTFGFGRISANSTNPNITIKMNNVAQDQPDWTLGSDASYKQEVTYSTSGVTKFELQTTNSSTTTLMYVMIETPSTTYTLTATATKNNMMGTFSGSDAITNGTVSDIESGALVTDNGDNTFTVGEITVTAPASIAGSVEVDGEDEEEVCTWRFKEWNNLPASVTADADDVEAVYIPTFPITYNTNGGTINETYYNWHEYTGSDEDEVLTLPTDVTKTGYDFAGWYQQNGSGSLITEIYGDAYGGYVDHGVGGNYSLAASWTANNYTLTWDLAGGTVKTAGTGAAASATGTPSSSVAYGTSLTAPIVTKLGYAFAGWDETPATNMPAEDVTYTATWTELPVVTNLRTVNPMNINIPLAWNIPGICDLSNPVLPLAKQTGKTSSKTYSSANDDVTVVGTMPQYEQFGVGFTIPATTGIEWISFDYKGTIASGDGLWGGVCNASNAYWQFDDNPMEDIIPTGSWQNTGHRVINRIFWNDGSVTPPMEQSVSQVAIYDNTGKSDGSSGTFYVRNVRYHVENMIDIDHVVLMRKAGSAATDTTDASATRLYSGTKSHYTDDAEKTLGVTYYYTVFAVDASGNISAATTISKTITDDTPRYVTYAKGNESATGDVPTDETVYVTGTTATLAELGTLALAGYAFMGWSDGTDTYQPGDSYTMPDDDVTFTAQWRNLETTLIIPTVTHLDATNYHAAPAFESYNVDGSGAIKCIDISGNESADWKFTITPGYYSLVVAYGAPGGYSTNITVAIYDVDNMVTPAKTITNEVVTNYEATARRHKYYEIVDLTGLSNAKTYKIVVTDTYGDATSHACIGYIDFNKLTPITITDDISLDYKNVKLSNGTAEFDVKNDANVVTCVEIENQNHAEWLAYITPNYYTIDMLYGTPKWSTNVTFSIINPSTGSAVYSPSALTHSNTEVHWYEEHTWSDVDLTGLSASQPYIIRVADTYGENGSRPKIAHIDFIPTKYELAWSSNGGNALTGDYTSGDVAAGVAITAPDDPTRTGYTFDSWNSAVDGTGDDLGAKMPMKDVTYYAQWEIIDYTIAHSDATNGSYTIKVGDASAVSTNTTGNYNQTVALAATPSSGYVIDGWNVSGATVGNNNIASTSFTMPAGNVTVAPTFKLMPNVYYYQDGTRYVSSTYKTPDGGTATLEDNQTINSGSEWTVSNSISGLTVSAKGCTYDGKSGNEIHITSYLKVPKDGDNSNKYVKFVVAAGYKATSLKMKIGGYSSNPTVTLKPYTTELGDAISYTGTVGGVATTENNFKEISWSNLAAGTYYLNVSGQNAYISEITAQTESTGYVISFAGNGNTGGSTASHTAITSGANVTLNSNGYTKTGYDFSHWTANVDVTVNSETVHAGDPIEDGATIQNVTSNIALTAQWTALSSKCVTTNATWYATYEDAHNGSYALLDGVQYDIETLGVDGDGITMGWIDAEKRNTYFQLNIGDLGVIKEVKITIASIIAKPESGNYGIMADFFEDDSFPNYDIEQHWDDGDSDNSIATESVSTGDLSLRPVSGDNNSFAFQTYTADLKISGICIYYEPAPSSEKQLLGLKFSNGFDAFIDESKHTVTAYYLYGTDAPTVSSYTVSDEASYSKVGTTITVTAEDGSTQDYTLTLSTVTPYAGTGSEETFTGSEPYIKGGKWESSMWTFQKNDDGEREISGRNRLYFFVTACEKITLKSGAESRAMKVYRNGVELATPTASGSSGSTIDIEGAAGAAMYALVSNQTSGSGKFSNITIVPNCTDPGLAFAEDSKTTTLCDAAPTNALTNTHGVTVSYTSSDEDVATVASDGTITLKGAGETTITASSSVETVSAVKYCADEATYTITVASSTAAGLSYSSTSVEKDYGASNFTNTLTNSNSLSVTYSSSNEAVATVDENGEVTIKAAGTTIITASSEQQKVSSTCYAAGEASYTLTVYPVYTVSYNAMGGTCSPTTENTTTVLGKVTLPSATNSTYSLVWVESDGTEAGAAGDKYKTTSDVTLYAKWSGSCAGGGGGSPTLFSWAKGSSTSNIAISAGGSESLTSDNRGTLSTGTSIVAKNSSASDNSLANNENGYKLGTNDIAIEIQGTSNFAAGDVVTITGRHGSNGDASRFFVVTPTTITSIMSGYDTSDTVCTNRTTSTSSDVEYTVTLKSAQAGSKIHIFRSPGQSMLVKTITVTRSGGTCYTVTYDGNGATSGYVNDPTQYAEDATVNVSSSTGSYTRDGGYEFNGWNTKADGSGDKIAYFTITKDTTLYAQWRIVVDANTTNLTAYDDPKHKDVRVTNGATLTLTQDTTVRNITVETGSTLNVNTTNGDGSGDGITLTANSLSLVGGWGTVGEETKYDMPRVYIDPKSTLTKTVNAVNFDIAVDERNYYPIALPFGVDLNDVNYVNSTLSSYVSSHREACYGTYFAIKDYDGEKRAERGGNTENWKLVEDGTLTPGKGYILSAVTVPGLLDANPYAVIRFPMKNIANGWTTLGEQGTVSAVTKNVIEVTAYVKAEGETAKANKGWNLLGIPYMSCYQTGADMYTGEGAAAILQGKFDFETNSFKEDGIRYVSVPTHDFSEYLQYNIEDEGTKLLPGWCFFVQVETTGNLTYAVTNQETSSDLPIYAPQREQEHKPTVKTGIILSSETASDKTTILVSDKYSVTDYEINADLEKMFGNAYTLATYSLMGEARLAYNAMTQTEAAGVIPIGYRAPADGEYTFAINPRYAENFEHVNLIDYETGFVTDLLQSTYTFATERTQNDERFALNVVTRQDTATDIENGANGGNGANGVRKLIIEDKMFIIVDGRMYDAKGVMVK